MEFQIGVVSQHDVARRVEVVERKGLGHPDTLCDVLAERLSLALSRFYLERFGAIQHHNVDKALLWSGVARPRFGGGEIVAPIEIFLAGRATLEVGGVAVPADSLAVEESRSWLREHMHALDADAGVEIRPLLRPGAPDLVELYARGGQTGVFLANDTSCGVGYAPQSQLECVVDRVEREISSAALRAGRLEMGEDVKVMGVRTGEDIHLTVGCAMVGRHLPDIGAYLEARERVVRMASDVAAHTLGRSVRVDVNAADDPARESVFLTVTGTSAEGGDDGGTGRGNRVNGLITPGRPMTMESVAGKNPVTHVGKLYNLAANLLAAALVESLPEVLQAQCTLVSQIGRPIRQPRLVDLLLTCEDRGVEEALAPRVREIAGDQLAAIDGLASELLSGAIALDRWPLRR